MLRTVAGKLVIVSLMVVCFVRGATADPLWAGDRILIDFCDNFTGTTDGSGWVWNKGLNHGIYRIATPGIIQNLKNTDGVSTQVGFRTPNWFETSNAMGLATSALSNYPDFATKDSVVLNPSYDPTAQCVFDGLDTNLTYNLTFYGSRGVTADPRVLQVTIDGVSQSYDAGGTVGEGLVTFTGISPNESGEIVIDFSTPNLGYLGVIELAAIDMTQTPVLSPDGGPITASQIVTITCDTPGAEIHYTLNDEPPTLQSPLYTSPIEVNPGQTLSARAWAPGYSPSGVKSAVYTACTNPVYIYRGDGSVRVDGDLSEWLENEFIPLTNNYYGEPQVRNAAYAVRWDAATNQFYVAVKVYDPVHVFVDMYDNWDAQDGVEVYVHTTGGLPYEYETAQNTAQRYILGLTENRTEDPSENVWATFAGIRIVPRDDIGFKAAGVEEVDEGGHPTGWLFYEMAITAYEWLASVGEPLPGKDPVDDSTTPIVSPLVPDDWVGVDVVVGDKYNTAFGMLSANNIINKHNDWRKIGVHRLTMHPADFNMDGKFGSEDIDLLFAKIGAGTNDPVYDLNSDGLVNQADSDVLILTLLQSHYGDANLDGSVDVGDLGILAANYGGTGKTWSQGDFNGDGAVDVGDLGILAANYGSSTSNFEADYAKVFDTAADDEVFDSSLCSGLGFSLIIGVLLMGLMLVKLEK